jgi:TetR/AcrR family transcriptional regulator, transcriptional repressor for nem operon
MGRPRQFDPEEVLDRSMHCFWENGYHETSVEDLVEATGVRPGSLYNAFSGGKRELFLDSLERYSKLVVPEKLGALGQPGASVPEIRAYFDGLVSDLLTVEGQVGCLMVNSTIELALDDAEVNEIVSAHMRRLQRTAARALANAKRDGALPATLDPEAKATQLMATALGLMVIGKTRPGREVLQTIVDQAFAELAQ